MIGLVPEPLENAIWFEDARANRLSTCSKCSEENRCGKCSNRHAGEVFLHYNIPENRITKLLKKLDMVPVPDLQCALSYIGVNAQFEIFNQKRIRYLEKKFRVNINIYEIDDEESRAVREPKIPPENLFPKTLNLMLRHPYPDTLNGLIENFQVINNQNRLPKIYRCDKTKNCKYSTRLKHHYEKHIGLCKNFNKEKRIAKQVSYGDNKCVLKEMVTKNILPPDVLSYNPKYHCTWDIETIEAKNQGCAPLTGMVQEAQLNLLSIAIGSNLPGYESKCWVRKSADPECEKDLVKKFVAELTRLWKLHREILPDYFKEAEIKIGDEKYLMKQRKAKWYEYHTINRYCQALAKFTCLNCFGFNSAKFDLPTIAGPLFLELSETSYKVDIMKKMSSYFMISTEKFSFKDCLKFTAPCSYDKFAKVWNAPTSKSIWPYNFYTSVEEIRGAKKFPPYAAFKSELNPNKTPSMQQYIEAKTEFYRRKLLPKGHPDKLATMLGWLKYYNLQDVRPLATAIENCFTSYEQYFNVKPMIAASLPSLAQSAMFANYPKSDPLIFTFNEKNNDIKDLFRSNVYGGLVNVYKRHVTTFDQPNIPDAARYCANGEPYTLFTMFDFTSMYLSCQKQDMPTSPGLRWELRNDGTFNKTIMCENHSFKAQQWLTYEQATGIIFLHNFLY